MTAFTVTHEPKPWQEPPLREIRLMKTRSTISKALEPVRIAVYSSLDAAPLADYSMPHYLHAAAINAVLREEAITLT